MKELVRTALLVSLLSVTLAACCDEKALPGAIRNLYSDKASERNKALLLIANCGKRAESSVPRISQLMYDENVGVASSAAYALRSIDTKSARAALKAAEQARAARRAHK